VSRVGAVLHNDVEKKRILYSRSCTR